MGLDPNGGPHLYPVHDLPPDGGYRASLERTWTSALSGGDGAFSGLTMAQMSATKGSGAEASGLKFRFDKSITGSQQKEFNGLVDGAKTTEKGAEILGASGDVFVRATGDTEQTRANHASRILSIDPRDPAYLSPLTRANFKLHATELPPDGPLGKMVTMIHELAHIVKNARDEGFGGHNVRDNENPFRNQIGLSNRLTYAGHPVYGFSQY